ncbi:hypothetical protein GOP47_0013556 [Adiantum capillus-veneris]|uniref:leucine--tRNA ligase n=1 Tax=Adiantum capillus-veneris TaxID=13818 RepID=A0A9D4ZFF4_ADICA|nr:hypothetical protein GOP47_0013556 [Adiantum capillus-veneris]
MESSEPEVKKSFVRRDELLRIQEDAQRRWRQERAFEIDAPSASAQPGDKFFGNFPFPYMNGALHLGHAFSFSKLEFASAFYRLKGRHVLLPFGFHCTGMPIKACADKLQREIEQFGNPPVFPVQEQAPTTIPTASSSLNPPSNGDNTVKAEPEKFKSKKSKVQAKTGVEVYQWNIMASLNISPEEIPKFTDPAYWLTYFPAIAVDDLKTFGAGVDWRRSFITTELNPFFDSFVRWQFRALKKQQKVVKDLRYAVYSPRDGQPCADHDRASGEGVQPQEYTLIKLQVKPPFSGKLQALEGKNVYLAAATLRPETMYGQTNLWVLPDGEYGAFEVNDSDVFVVTSRAARNLAFQLLSRVPEKPTRLLELRGHDLIGLPLIAPLSMHQVVYALPMLTILTDKGTGIVTSVPSDSPDDYMSLLDLKNKPALRAKYGVKDEWVLPYDVIPIINIPDIGDKSAEVVCKELKIKSPNDQVLLTEAKKRTYLKGFTDGIMLVGEHKGEKVQDAKPLIKEMLIQSGQAVKYSEPENKVMSRSGEECVVALTDQWYLIYGEDEWKAKAEECLSNMELYNDETRHGFEHTLGWLNQWACSRSFGLGTRIPWDEQFLIESLSDSTIYMAYYTISHLLQAGDIYGHKEAGIKAEQLTDDVWDYVFGDGPFPSTDVPENLLKLMKKEFSYWYPFDIRVSGKDLIQNHLTFCIYNHTAMFPKEKWPRAMRCNGFLMLNSEKMSKSTGNFRTLKQAIEEFSADATRFALADSGDLMDDANFVFETANSAILRLTKEITWMKEVLAAEQSLRKEPPTLFADRVFQNEINFSVHVTEQNYESMMFRDALKTGFYDLQTARDEYRLSCGAIGMNRDLIYRFMEVQTRLLTPICPHYAEHVWSSILNREGFAIRASWPTAPPADLTLQKANKYLQDTITSFRKLLQKQTTTKKGKASVPVDVKPTIALVYVAEKYEGWKEECLKVLQQHFYPQTKSFAHDADIMDALQRTSVAQMGDLKQIKKTCSSFLKFKKEEAVSVGPHALDVTLPFGEMQVLEENAELIQRQLGLEELSAYAYSDAHALRLVGSRISILNQTPPSPGSPVAIFLVCVSCEG